MTKTVMAVDDEKDVIFVLERILEKEGFEVHGAIGGEECIESFEKVNPDILFMDVMMPNMSGWEVIRKLKDTGVLGNTKVIMLTVTKEPPEEHDDLSPYVMDYIRKPVKRDDLLKRVERLSAL